MLKKNNNQYLKLNYSYTMLKNLKLVLGFDNPELNLLLIMNLCKGQNEKEFLLLTYLVEQIFYMPQVVKIQFNILDKYLRNTEKYNEQIKKIENLFKTNKCFLNYKKNIYKELELQYLRERYFYNSIIYEIAHEYIKEDAKLSLKRPILNLYFLRKWLDSQLCTPALNLTDSEIKIMNYLIEGNLKEQILKNNLIKEIDNKYFLEAEVYQIIPAKMQVQTLSQALAKYYYLMLYAKCWNKHYII